MTLQEIFIWFTGRRSGISRKTVRPSAETVADRAGVLATGGLSDPRVTYWEPAKWAAKLRANKTDGNVLLLKINMGAGHAGKSGRWEHIREIAEAYAFALTQVE